MRFFKTCFYLFLFFIYTSMFPATFIVNNPIELQTALNTSSVNGENDIIQLAGGNYNVTSTLTFWSDEEFSLQITSNNSPVLNGGDLIQIFELMTVSDNGNLILENFTLEHGKADIGGAMYAETENADISVNNCIVTDNQANNVCGGINLYSITGNIEISNCEFRRNSSPNTTGYPVGTAGGLFIQTEGVGTQISVSNCIFEYNSAQRDGAGTMLYPLGNSSSVTVQNNEFYNNIANEFGGGCWIRCPGGNSFVTYENNISTNNSTAIAGSGGGTYIEIETGEIEVTENEFYNNDSIWQGGALWILNNGGSVNIETNTFSENSAIQTGGAANIYLEMGTATIEHNVFFENESSDSGGGLCFSTSSGSVSVFNNTFWSNSALDGGDVYFYFINFSSSASFYNNILYGSSSLPALSFSGAQSVTAIYSDIQNGTGQTWFGTGCIEVNPLFIDPAGSNFNLTSASPCIDTGDPTSQNDPDGTISDMGALYFDQSSLSIPENINVTYSSGSVIINWNAVAGAASYTIYSDDDPNGNFETVEWSGVQNEWSDLVSGYKKFYRVTANY